MTFDKREQAFEQKFAHDEELKFKGLARCNKLVGNWAAEKLGLKGKRIGNGRLRNPKPLKIRCGGFLQILHRRESRSRWLRKNCRSACTSPWSKLDLTKRAHEIDIRVRCPQLRGLDLNFLSGTSLPNRARFDEAMGLRCPSDREL